MSTTRKPPIGVKPEKMVLQSRNVDLARALAEYAVHEDRDQHTEVMLKWSDELSHNLKRLKEIEDEAL